MSVKMVVGGILIALGIMALVYQGISYTSTANVVDLGPMQVTTEKTRRIPLPPILGVVAIVGGILLVVVDRKGRVRAA